MPDTSVKLAPIKADVECVWRAHARLGESPCWDARCDCLVWVDIEGRRLHAFHPADQRRQTWRLTSRISSLDVPSTDWKPPAGLGGRTFVGSGDEGLLWIGVHDDRVEVMPIADPERGVAENRFNDGKMGPDGRYWAGTMHNAERFGTGSLYAFRPDARHAVLDSGYVVANGPGFSPDGSTVYHTDSPARTIYSFVLDESGSLVRKRTFVQFGSDDGYPDGMAVDREGHIWVAMWDGGRLEKISPDGQRLGSVPIPTPRPTSCAFVAADEKRMFVTSASRGLPSDDRLAGGLFHVQLC